MQTYNNLPVVQNCHFHPILSEINGRLLKTENQNPLEQLNKNLSEMLLIKTVMRY